MKHNKFDPQPDITTYELALIMAELWNDDGIKITVDDEFITEIGANVSRHFKPAE